MLLPATIKKGGIQKIRESCTKKFIYYFPKGYLDTKYIAWERQYKLDAHLEFQAQLNKKSYTKLLNESAFEKIAGLAARIESKTNLLFSFEKMALRDALKSPEGAKAFAKGLFDYIYGNGNMQSRFEAFIKMIGTLPRKQTRVLTWPVVTVFGFIADPLEHIFLKPRVTQIAAAKYRFDLNYSAHPNWNAYENIMDFQAVELTQRAYHYNYQYLFHKNNKKSVEPVK